MPAHHRVRLTRRLEHIVRALYFFEVAVIIPLFEDDIDSPVRGALCVCEVALAAELSAVFPEGENKSKNWLTHKIVDFKG